MSSRIVTVLPVIAAIVLLISALGIVARIAPQGAGYRVADTGQPIPPAAVCSVSEAGVVSPSNQGRRRLL